MPANDPWTIEERAVTYTLFPRDGQYHYASCGPLDPQEKAMRIVHSIFPRRQLVWSHLNIREDWAQREKAKRSTMYMRRLVTPTYAQYDQEAKDAIAFAEREVLREHQARGWPVPHPNNAPITPAGPIAPTFIAPGLTATATTTNLPAPVVTTPTALQAQPIVTPAIPQALAAAPSTASDSTSATRFQTGLPPSSTISNTFQTPIPSALVTTGARASNMRRQPSVQSNGGGGGTQENEEVPELQPRSKKQRLSVFASHASTTAQQAATASSYQPAPFATAHATGTNVQGKPASADAIETAPVSIDDAIDGREGEQKGEAREDASLPSGTSSVYRVSPSLWGGNNFVAWDDGWGGALEEKKDN